MLETIEVEQPNSRKMPVLPGAALLAPFRAIFDPTAAAGIFLRSSMGAFLLAHLLQAALLGVAVAVVAVGSLCLEPVQGRQLSLVEARRLINSGAAIGPCEATVAAGFVGGLVLPLALSLFYLPRLLRGGSAAAAIGRGYRAAAVNVLMAAVIVLVTFGIFATATRIQGRFSALGFRSDALLFPLAILCMFSAITWFISSAERALMAAAEPAVPEIPPRCEGCGYDFSHQPASGFCTECNEPVARSLTPGVRRPGVQWESPASGLATWFSSSVELLLSPAQFYARLQFRLLQGEDAARRFCLLHYRYIAFVAALWFATMLVVMNMLHMARVATLLDTICSAGFCATMLVALGQGTSLGRFQRWQPAHALYFLLPAILILQAGNGVGSWSHDSQEALFLPLIFGFAAALVCWFGHRLAAFIILVIPMRTRILADFRWAEKIICYEAAFLWVYCVTWGVLVTSFMVFGTWMSNSRAFDGLRASGLLAEPAAVIASTVLLSIVWILRYRIALRAARWNNF